MTVTEDKNDLKNKKGKKNKLEGEKERREKEKEGRTLGEVHCCYTSK